MLQDFISPVIDN